MKEKRRSRVRMKVTEFKEKKFIYKKERIVLTDLDVTEIIN